jgi:hypothetical protein
MPARTKPVSTANPPCLRLQRRTKNYFIRVPARLGGGSRWFGSDSARAAVRYAEFCVR